MRDDWIVGRFANSAKTPKTIFLKKIITILLDGVSSRIEINIVVVHEKKSLRGYCGEKRSHKLRERSQSRLVRTKRVDITFLFWLKMLPTDPFNEIKLRLILRFESVNFGL